MSDLENQLLLYRSRTLIHEVLYYNMSSQFISMYASVNCMQVKLAQKNLKLTKATLYIETTQFSHNCHGFDILYCYYEVCFYLIRRYEAPPLCVVLPFELNNESWFSGFCIDVIFCPLTPASIIVWKLGCSVYCIQFGSHLFLFLPKLIYEIQMYLHCSSTTYNQKLNFKFSVMQF